MKQSLHSLCYCTWSWAKIGNHDYLLQINCIFFSPWPAPYNQALYLVEWQKLHSYDIWALDVLSSLIFPHFSTGQGLLAKGVLIGTPPNAWVPKIILLPHYVAVTHFPPSDQGQSRSITFVRTRALFSHCWLSGTRNKNDKGEVLVSNYWINDITSWWKHLR